MTKVVISSTMYTCSRWYIMYTCI